ncbi:hypothetical protein [Paraclostridium tenue]|uniref:Uncharacterized protein n=1 Tax=Paraclostridium tenue TaxID=1737 RepID=A0ABP3XBH9_9FIRM
MLIEQLDLETRSKIYGYTKKVLRKYQKGIVTGKITADKFAENILSNEDINSILDKNIIDELDFKNSYIKYIETLIKNQNENISNFKKNNVKSSITQQIQLKKLLIETGHELTIPPQYLSSSDVTNLLKYISTGEIDLGNERIYNYIKKNKKH